MLNLKTKEDLVEYASLVLTLSEYDFSFVESLRLRILDRQSITTKQVALFDKIISKHKHHFKIDIDRLPWASTIVESKKSTPSIEIQDQKIRLWCPFDPNFMRDFRNIVSNPFKWDKEEKCYIANYGTMALKIVTTSTLDYFKDIKYCPITVSLLNTLEGYSEQDCWNPTLVKINDLFLIAATNEHIDVALGNMILGDDSKSLSTLAEYGVTIHPSIISGNVIKKLAANYSSEVDFVNMNTLLELLSDIGCDCVCFSGYGVQKKYKALLESKLNENGIKCIEVGNSKILEVLPKTKYPVLLQLTMVFSMEINPLVKNYLRKVIKIKNSTPIDIR